MNPSVSPPRNEPTTPATPRSEPSPESGSPWCRRYGPSAVVTGAAADLADPAGVERVVDETAALDVGLLVAGHTGR